MNHCKKKLHLLLQEVLYCLILTSAPKLYINRALIRFMSGITDRRVKSRDMKGWKIGGENKKEAERCHNYVHHLETILT